METYFCHNKTWKIVNETTKRPKGEIKAAKWDELSDLTFSDLFFSMSPDTHYVLNRVDSGPVVWQKLVTEFEKATSSPVMAS